MHRNNIPLRFLLGLVAFGLVIALSVGLMLSENGIMRWTGIVIGSIFLVWWLIAPLVDARLSERHVERFPELLRNDPVGEQAVAAAAFRSDGDGAEGQVRLNGELWRARCPGVHSPAAGEPLRVYRREGLTLLVRPLGDD